MLCVLRIAGSNLKDDLLEGLVPMHSYKAALTQQPSDGAYYDVAEADTKDVLAEQIAAFLQEHADALTKLSRLENVTVRNLDIGMLLLDQAMSISFDLDPELLKLAAPFDLSITVAVMRASPEENIEK